MLDLGIDQSFHSCILSIHAVIPEAMGSILVGGLSYKDQSFHQELHYQLVEAQYSLLLENLSPRFVDGDHLHFHLTLSSSLKRLILKKNFDISSSVPAPKVQNFHLPVESRSPDE